MSETTQPTSPNPQPQVMSPTPVPQPVTQTAPTPPPTVVTPSPVIVPQSAPTPPPVEIVPVPPQTMPVQTSPAQTTTLQQPSTPSTVVKEPVPVVPVHTVVSNQTSAPSISQEANIVTELLTRYKTYLSTNNPSTTTFKNAAMTFANVVERILRTPTQDVMLAVWNFFVDNKNGVLLENTALQGVDSLAVQTRFRAEIVYTLFRLSVTGVDIGNQKRFDLSLIQSRLKCNALILFLQAQAQNVTKKT